MFHDSSTSRTTGSSVRSGFWRESAAAAKNDWLLYVLLRPAVLYFYFVHYLPMFGVQIAFKIIKPVLGIVRQPVGGTKH